MNTTDLANYNKGDFKTGRNIFIRLLWYFTNIFCFNNGWFPFSKFKVFLLRLYGAKIGKGVVIKPSVNIKFPWRLKIGNNVWIGENVWIDNLANVEIGDNACVSQGALLLTGNHNYKLSTFDLITKPIIIEQGAWIGAKTVVCPGVVCKSHSVLSVGSVAIGQLDEYSVYSGNPAVFKKKREIN